MLYDDFSNSNIYLNKLIEHQKHHDFFSHLNNNEEDTAKIITRLYNEDDYLSLFDPVFEKISNSEIAVNSGVIYLSLGNGALIDCNFLDMVRTKNYFYCLIYDFKEYSYDLPWFKNGIKDLFDFELYQKIVGFLFENNRYDLANYLEIYDDNDLENYDPLDILIINVEDEIRINYVRKDAEIIRQNFE